MEHLLKNHSEIIHILLEAFMVIGTIGTFIATLVNANKTKLYASLYATDDMGRFHNEKVVLRIVNKSALSYKLSGTYSLVCKLPFEKYGFHIPICPLEEDKENKIGEYDYVLDPLDTRLMDLGTLKEFCLDVLEIIKVRNHLHFILLLYFASFTIMTLSDNNIKISVSKDLRQQLISTWNEIKEAKLKETFIEA